MKKKISFITGICLIIYTAAVNIISTAKVAFSVPIVICGAGFILYAVMGRQIVMFINKNILLKKLCGICKAGIIGVLIMLLGIEGIIIAYPKHYTENSDYILVLGAGLSNGIEPSLTLKYRLDAAMECIQKYGNSGKIIVSGGQGSDEKIAESEAMKKYLLNCGISQDRILIENKSSTTSENFKFSKSIIENDSGKPIDEVKVKIVTTSFHAFRSRILAMKNGYENVTNYSSPTVWYLIPATYVREAFAVVKSVLFD